MGLTDSKHGGHHHEKKSPSFMFDARTNQLDMVLRNSLVKRNRRVNSLPSDWDTNHNQLMMPEDDVRPSVSREKQWPTSCLSLSQAEDFLEKDGKVSCWNWPQGHGEIDGGDVMGRTELVVDSEEAEVFAGVKFKDENEGIYDTVDKQLPACPACNGIYCNYTCHMRCRPLVSLDCTANPLTNHSSPALECIPSFTDISNLSPLFEDVIDEENCDINEFTTATISSAELRKQIENYNLNVASGEISLLEDGRSFSGFIRVHMRLCRPVNVYTVPRPPSIYDVLNDYSEGTSDNKKTLTSFYLPRDTVKALHITSETTTKDVIITLLNKFKVVDNPHKFALYERDYEIGESSKVRMRRIHDCEYPLMMILMWHNQGHTGRHLVLQENDTGDISWDAFSLPELSNFLVILKREEEEYLQQVRLKYSIMGEKLHEALQERERLGSGEPSHQFAPQPPPRRRHSDFLHLRGQQDPADLLQERLIYDSLPDTKITSNFKQLTRGNLTYNGFEEHKKR